MGRRLTTLLVLGSALGIAFPAFAHSDRAPGQGGTNDKLLIRDIRSSQDPFLAGLKEAGWNPRNKANLRYYNVRSIIGREDLRRLEITLNSKTRKDVDRSA